MKKAFTIFTLVLCSFQSLKINAQIDTLFWFAAPWTSPDHTWRDPIKLHISGEPATYVHVYQPAAIAPNRYDTTFFIPASGLFDYTFWRDAGASPTNRGYDSLECRPANTVLPYGIKISASFNVTVVYDQITRQPTFYNPETFSLKGQNALGTNFICPAQTSWLNQTLASDLNGDATVTQPRQQINIVSTQSNTIVWITPKCNIVGHSANVTYSIMMNLGDVYTLENVTNLTSTAGNNLSGTSITSNNPIAVTYGDDSVRNPGGGCYDFIGDQIVPVENLGNEYIANMGFMYPASGESVYFVGTDTLTQVTVTDIGVTTYTLNKGVTQRHLITQPLTYINATKNIYVLQTTGFGCESGADILPPIGCAGSDSVIFSRNNPQNFSLNLITKTSAIGNFQLNGNSSLVPASAFTVVPGTAGMWSGAQIQYSTSVIPLNVANTIKNTSDVFTFGIINGGPSTGGLFHYMSSFPRKITTTAGPDLSYCNGSTPTISLTGTISGGSNTGTWTTTNGTGTFGTYSSVSNTISTTYTLSAGDQSLSQIKFFLSAFGACVPSVDSLVVNIFPFTFVNLTASPGTVCASSGVSVLNGTPPGGTYTGSFVTGTNFNIPATPGTYTANYAFTDVNGCINNDTVAIYVANCTGIKNIEFSELKVYPNPVTDIIKIEGQQGTSYTVVLYDITGKIVMSRITFNGSLQLSLEKLNSGLYYLKINTGKTEKYIKLSKL